MIHKIPVLQRTFQLLITGVAVSCMITGCKTGGKTNYPPGIDHVIVIGVDGMSPDGIRKANVPVLKKMVTDGSVKWNVRTALPSSSSTNWASMIMGAGPEQHGVLSNEWEKDNASLPPVVRGEEGIFPTIFSVVHQNRPDAEIGAVYNWDGFGRLFEKKAVNYDHTFSTEDSTTTDFINYIKAKKPVFAFLHLDHVDHAGHHDGHGTPAYLAAIGKADSLIGKVLDGVKAAGIEDNTLIIVTSDHGGKGYGHGGATIEEAEIAMFLYGKGVKKGYEIPEEVYTYDLAATIAFALNMESPYAWIGRPVKSAFEGFSVPANLWKGKKLIASPVISPAPHLYQQAGGLYIDTPATVEIISVANRSTIRYTTNGSEPDSSSKEYKSPFRLDTTTVVKARSYDSEGNESPASAAYFRVLKSGGGNGLNTILYEGTDWKRLPVFENVKPASKWVSHEFNIDQEQVNSMVSKGKDNFGVVFNGFLEIDQPGQYTFYLQSDDGSNLYIDNKEVVNNDGGHGVIEAAGAVQLGKGKHAIRVEYFNGFGGFWLDAYYKGPEIPRQIIPANKLFLKN
ncbi:alkaline phosphatase family protein [Flavihumibacter profundi]|uniref:alkaline phosphatase family protein n=1 Tax=Flavihumibacter profundi TaxID=2716883 RepID=UPI001CC585A6|nr:alkaline phosphatase family protein [Flavihumibacter profundi]MBZ5857460.1 alkaline phosphatase family protein [Flavihumibacter profundi]